MNRDDLSPRELEVLRLVADGLTTAQVGARLGISPSTVKHHMTTVCVRLRAANRTAAVVEALRRGLIELAVTASLAGH